MEYLVGIDDTDNLESRGTGYRARQLGETIAPAGMDGLASTSSSAQSGRLWAPD